MKPNEKPEVRPADALGTLSKRSQASRVGMVVGIVVLLFVVVFVVGLIVKSVTGGAQNAGDLPRVEL